MKATAKCAHVLACLLVGVSAAGCTHGDQERLDASSQSLAIVESFADVNLATLSEEQKNLLMAHLPVVLGEKATFPQLITKLSDLDQKAVLSIVWDASSGKVPSPCLARLVVVAGPGKVFSDTTFGCAGHHGSIIAIRREVPPELQRSALTIKADNLDGEVIQYLVLIKGKPILVRLQGKKGAVQNWYDGRGAAVLGPSNIAVDSVEGVSQLLKQGDLIEQLALLMALAVESYNLDEPTKTMMLRRAKPVQELLKTLGSSTHVWVREQARLCLDLNRSE